MSYLIIKNSFDIIFALIALIFLFPILLIIYFLVLFFLGMPVFFIQLRPGLYKKPFYLIKFRTMRSIYDKDGFLLPDEQRLSKFGKFLRKTSLDELPELINIIKGEMSFIGPRPLLMEYLPLYNERQNSRHLVKPGFSGLAQINGRNSISWRKKFELDYLYVKKQSFHLDLKILLTTIWKTILCKNINTKEGKIMPAFKGNDKS